MEFKCSGCNYTSYLKVHVKKHINKKKKCSENPTIVEVQVDIICNNCNKKYATKNNLKRHLKTCKTTNNIVKESNNNNLIKLTDKVEELSNKIEKLHKIKPETLIEIKQYGDIKSEESNKLTETKSEKPSQINIHIYLLREREFLNSEKHIYKIGYTTCGIKRFSKYPNDSEILLMINFNTYNPERFLIKQFKEKFRHCKEIGSEYFEGKPSMMINIIHEMYNSIFNN